AYEKTQTQKKILKTIYTGNKKSSRVTVSSGGRFIAYILSKPAGNTRKTIIPNYVTATGFTEDIHGRTKVGVAPDSGSLFVFDRERDTVIAVKTDSIPGIQDLPDYVKDYPQLLKKAKRSPRAVRISGISWSPKNNYAVVDIYAYDNKDRWLMKLDAATGRLSLLDRQRDEAWVGGPGINSTNTGWVSTTDFWFQSESTGYSHLYTVNVVTGQKTALTSGQYEVQKCLLSGDRK